MAAYIESQKDEDAVAEDTPEPQTLTDYVQPRRGYIDRMLRPGRMTEGAWGGKPHFKCPKCGQETFNRADAAKHRC